MKGIIWCEQYTIDIIRVMKYFSPQLCRYKSSMAKGKPSSWILPPNCFRNMPSSHLRDHVWNPFKSIQQHCIEPHQLPPTLTCSLRLNCLSHLINQCTLTYTFVTPIYKHWQTIMIVSYTCATGNRPHARILGSGTCCIYRPTVNRRRGVCLLRQQVLL